MAVPPAPRGSGSAQEFGIIQAAMSEAHLVVHGPPDFPANAQVLGICGVSEENAHVGKYAWIVADFLHWKTLFFGVGFKSAQTWLSSLDLPETIHGDSIDSIVNNTKDGRPAKLPNDNDAFTTAFLKSLVESARAAVAKKTALVLLVFAPVTPEQDICVDFGGEKISITAERICETVKSAVGNVQLPVVLVTPSPFTGGWLCRPSLMGWPVSPNPDTSMRIIAKTCGGAFANRFITTFTESHSPLLTMAQRQKIKYDDPMPLHPTELQTDCLHYLQRKIHESLERRFSALAKTHSFVLVRDTPGDPSTVSDIWADYSPRKGRTVNFWANRWGAGQSPPTVNDPHRFEFLGEAFGGTRESQIFHLKYLAALELETCPGDWERRVGGITRELLTTFMAKLAPSEKDAKRVFDTIEFRSSSMVLAQIIAKAFGLALPEDLKCRYWHDKMDGVSDDYYKKLQFAFGDAHNLFDQAPMAPGERRHDFKNVRFLRAARWLSAAIAMKFKDGTRQDIENFVQNEVPKLISIIRDTQRKLLLENRAVTEAGLNWIAALDLGGEVKLTPEMTAAFAAAKAAQLPTAEAGLYGKSWRGAAAAAATLNPKAVPWRAMEVAPAQGEIQAEESDWNPITETKWAENESVAEAVTAAENSFDHNELGCAEEVEPFDVKPAPKDEPVKDKDLGATASPRIKVEEEEEKPAAV
ncbi:hypothetical protein C8A05DRAFT_15122 [Staphylotrichum tortipilum]|uniref:Uncharacterized protein n=1 Tax=Staphylotrichum tortipilum TaxID=2831512 RepID=A0AAN6RUS6_9PEZI|nr:hypothetical protein C8A05DRAFT_15122 [Staphylotrichum longicolle]